MPRDARGRRGTRRRPGGPTLAGLWRYARQVLRLAAYLDAPGDGRFAPSIPASQLIWTLLGTKVLRTAAYAGVERLTRRAHRAFGLERPISHDALAYFTDRLGPDRTRQSAAAVVRRAKRNKTLERSAWIGLVLDGSSFAFCGAKGCAYCHPSYDAKGNVSTCCHKAVMLSVVATGTKLVLPFDAQLYRADEGELSAAKTLLMRGHAAVGPRFADYVVVDGLYAGAPYIHLAGELGLPVVIRLKQNLPELYTAAHERFEHTSPTHVFQNGKTRVELWDADDFLRWQGLNWPRVRVLRYREHHSDGTLVDAYWFTNFSIRRVGSKSLYSMAKSRWGIENQGFNEAKNLYGLAHLPRHTPNSLLIHCLLTALALTLERLFRLRHLHRGGREPYAAIDLYTILISNLFAPAAYDTG